MLGRKLDNARHDPYHAIRAAAMPLKPVGVPLFAHLPCFATLSPACLRVAVCLLAFDRHHLVRLALDRVMRFLPAGWHLRVWQDGYQERHSGNLVGHAGRIGRNLAMYKARNVDFHDAGAFNNGPACAYWLAENWAFEEIGADLCIFIEDDIVISKHFFATMKALGRLAVNDPRIGAFSAFGNANLPWTAQWRQRRQLQPMHHRWGYGISRDYWRRFRPDYQEYLNILEGFDYRNRPNEAIFQWLRQLRNAETTNRISSQDGARTAIMLKLGCFSIMSTPSYAVNIGKRGIHSFPEFYQANQASIKGRHPFFPLPTRFPARLPEAAAQRLTAASRALAYW